MKSKSLLLRTLIGIGVAAVNDFIFIMMRGVIIGTYSTVFIAGPIIAVWHKSGGKAVKS